MGEIKNISITVTLSDGHIIREEIDELNEKELCLAMDSLREGIRFHDAQIKRAEELRQMLRDLKTQIAGIYTTYPVRDTEPDDFNGFPAEQVVNGTILRHFMFIVESVSQLAQLRSVIYAFGCGHMLIPDSMYDNCKEIIASTGILGLQFNELKPHYGITKGGLV